jgi:hypothetical protein
MGLQVLLWPLPGPWWWCWPTGAHGGGSLTMWSSGLPRICGGRCLEADPLHGQGFAEGGGPGRWVATLTGIKAGGVRWCWPISLAVWTVRSRRMAGCGVFVLRRVLRLFVGVSTFRSLCARYGMVGPRTARSASVRVRWGAAGGNSWLARCQPHRQRRFYRRSPS